MSKFIEGLKKFIQGILAAGLATWTFTMIPAESRVTIYPALLLFYAAAFGIYSYFNIKEHGIKNGGNK